MSALPSRALASLPAALPDSAGWQQFAACRFADRDLFFPPEEERGRYAAFREVTAQRICRSCPVRGECLGHALTADERYGVWGGMTAEERARLRRARRARGARRGSRPRSATGNLAGAALPPVSRRGPRGMRPGPFMIEEGYREAPGWPLTREPLTRWRIRSARPSPGSGSR